MLCMLRNSNVELECYVCTYKLILVRPWTLDPGQSTTEKSRAVNTEEVRSPKIKYEREIYEMSTIGLKIRIRNRRK